MFRYIIDPDMCMEISIDLLLTWQNERYSVIIDPAMCIEISDQYQYLGNCPPTPPLTQH